MKYFRNFLFKLQFYLPHSFLRLIKRNLQMRNLKNWKFQGYPSPPPHIIKAHLLKYLSKKMKLKMVVETGTFMGDMIDELQDSFDKLYSIEVFEPLYLRAKNIFKNNNKIVLLNGDSAVVLKRLIKNIRTPTLFWLDAHFSGSGTGKSDIETPIEKELDLICTLKLPHAIVIDDARLFDGTNDYPKLSKIKTKYQTTYTITVIHDMILLVK